MSINIDYFFNSDKSFEQLLREINELFGFNLIVDESETSCSNGWFFGMPLSFNFHTLENDRELNFQDYKYEIGFKTYMGSADLRDIQLSVVTFIALLLYRRMQISEGILVYDLQILLARYEEKIISEEAKGLFDKSSNKFVELPQHLSDLDKLSWQ